YQSEEYFDEADKEDENNHSNGNVVKRGIIRRYGSCAYRFEDSILEEGGLRSKR
ncbi:hypothetical protein Tco_1460726, partial [Tanacetum coccineum]